MALSNPIRGERRPGAVGQPLPFVEVRLKSEAGDIVTTEDTPGEIQVRGPNVFSEYWGKPVATAESFDQGGWFRTGDVVIKFKPLYYFNEASYIAYSSKAVIESGYYRIMGRSSVDIIKSGGYKLSVLY